MGLSFSVFTPTYNRCDNLLGAYDSLAKQTFKSFEWIIVDDGSTDETREIVEGLKKTADFDIRYTYQENQGKHIAQNKAVEVAKGELFLPLDADDLIVINGLEILWREWQSIPLTERRGYSGIGCHCMTLGGGRIGDQWPQNVHVSNDLEMHFKYKVRGEKWGPIRTDIMREHKSIEVKGHFLSESTVWFKIAEKYKKRYIDECLRIYEIHEDSVSKRNKAQDYNYYANVCAELIFINEFYYWYVKYDKREAIRKPMRLAKMVMNNGGNILFGDNPLFEQIRPIFPKLLVCCSAPYHILFLMKKSC